MTIIDSDLRSCEKCGRSFMPRSGSGGSVQRFCCTDCRLTFHRERLRSQRRALYAGPTTLPATAQPAPNEEAREAEGSVVLMSHYPTRRALREAGQSDLDAETGGAADRHLRKDGAL